MIAMTCHQAQDLIEAIASGDFDAPPPFVSHVATCRECAAALETARAVERALWQRPEPAAPADFTRAVAGAIRRERWESDEHLDRAFNVTVAAGVALIVVAIASLLNVSALAQMLMVAVDAAAELPNQTPVWPGGGGVPIAGIVMTVVVMGIGIWWWAERRSDLQSG